MDPQSQFGHNPPCWAYGRPGEGHILIHRRRERRCQCRRCGKTFSVTKGTALCRAHKGAEVVVQLVTLLAHGCPPQASVAAFGWDERTVARYQAEAGAQCRRVHEHVVEAGRVDLGQVQADELRVRIVGGVLWVATALAGASRLWLGGEERGLLCLKRLNPEQRAMALTLNHGYMAEGAQEDGPCEAKEAASCPAVPASPLPGGGPPSGAR